ncbi:MAG TPA: hypothetical protein VEA69_04430 [Tepidisphaeraceae bacterium]|nr:hypothetical protein [Tepidisphaeraceae bacterium]
MRNPDRLPPLLELLPKRQIPKPLIAGAGSLIVYPMCFVANLMSLAGHGGFERAWNKDPVQAVAFYIFLWATTAYPVILGLAFIANRLFANYDRSKAATRAAWAPLAYLGACVLLYATLSLIESRKW